MIVFSAVPLNGLKNESIYPFFLINKDIRMEVWKRDSSQVNFKRVVCEHCKISGLKSSWEVFQLQRHQATWKWGKKKVDFPKKPLSIDVNN